MAGDSKGLRLALADFALSTQDVNDWFYLWIIQEKMQRKMSDIDKAGHFTKEIALLRSNKRFKDIYEKFKVAYDACEYAGDVFTFPSKRIEEFEKRFVRGR